MIKNQFGDNPPLVVEKDKIIINDHVINSNDPTIIDVLSKHEQGHLFGTHDGRPMAIEIVAGLPMKYPTQVRVPGGGEVNHDEINYVPTQYDQPPPPQKSSNNGRVPPPPPPPAKRPAGFVPGSPRGQPKRRPPPPPQSKRPPPPIQPQGKRPPPPVRRPPPPGPPRRPPVPGPQRPTPPPPPGPGDSNNQPSINSGVKVKPPPQFTPPASGQKARPPPQRQPPPPQQQNRLPRPPQKRPPPPQKKPLLPQQGRPKKPPPQSQNPRYPYQGGLPKRPPTSNSRPPPPSGGKRPPQQARPPPPGARIPNRPQGRPVRPPPQQARPTGSRPTPAGRPISQGQPNLPPQRVPQPKRPVNLDTRPPSLASSPSTGQQGGVVPSTFTTNQIQIQPSSGQNVIRIPSPSGASSPASGSSNGGFVTNPNPEGFQLVVNNQAVDVVDQEDVPTAPLSQIDQASLDLVSSVPFVPLTDGQQRPAQPPVQGQFVEPPPQTTPAPQRQPPPRTSAPQRQPPPRRPQTTQISVPSVPQFSGNGILPQPPRPEDRRDSTKPSAPSINQITPNRPAYPPKRPVSPPQKPQVQRLPPPTEPTEPVTRPQYQTPVSRPQSQTPVTRPQTPKRPQRPQPPSTRRPPPPRTRPPPTRRPAQRPPPTRPTRPSRRPAVQDPGTTPSRPYTKIDEPAVSPAFGTRIPSPQTPGQSERRPYNEHPNPNKRRKPKPTPTINSGASYEIDADGEVTDVTLTGPFGGYQGVIQTAVEPSFTVEKGYGTRQTTQLVQINNGQSDAIDNEGWVTDINLRPSLLRPTGSYFNTLSLTEKEAPKTITYPNEWSPQGEQTTEIPFTPQVPTAPNTNFPREWTTRNNQPTIQPTVTQRPPYQTAYDTDSNNNWRGTVEEAEVPTFGDRLDTPPYSRPSAPSPPAPSPPAGADDRDVVDQDYEDAQDTPEVTVRPTGQFVQPGRPTSTTTQFEQENPNKQRKPYPSDPSPTAAEETVPSTSPSRPAAIPSFLQPTTPDRPSRPARPSAPERPIRPYRPPIRRPIGRPDDPRPNWAIQGDVDQSQRPRRPQVRPTGQFVPVPGQNTNFDSIPQDSAGSDLIGLIPTDPTDPSYNVYESTAGTSDWPRITPTSDQFGGGQPLDGVLSDTEVGLTDSNGVLIDPNSDFNGILTDPNSESNDIQTIANSDFNRDAANTQIRQNGQFPSAGVNEVDGNDAFESTERVPSTEPPRPVSPLARQPTSPPLTQGPPIPFGPEDQSDTRGPLPRPTIRPRGPTRPPFAARPPFDLRRPGFGPPTTPQKPIVADEETSLNNNVISGRPDNTGPLRPSPTQQTSVDSNDLDLPEVEPSSPEEGRPIRRPFVKPFRPDIASNPPKDTFEGESEVPVIEGTFEPKGPIIPLQTNELPFTTNVVVRPRKPIIQTTSGQRVVINTGTSFRPTRPTRIRLPTVPIIRNTISRHVH